MAFPTEDPVVACWRINQLDPDVVALQEIGGDEPLYDLRQSLGGTYTYHAVSAFPDRRGIRVAFLSRHMLDEPAEDIMHFPPGPASILMVLLRRATRHQSTAWARSSARSRHQKRIDGGLDHRPAEIKTANFSAARR
jgi:hypothetical protein